MPPDAAGCRRQRRTGRPRERPTRSMCEVLETPKCWNAEALSPGRDAGPSGGRRRSNRRRARGRRPAGRRSGRRPGPSVRRRCPGARGCGRMPRGDPSARDGCRRRGRRRCCAPSGHRGHRSRGHRRGRHGRCRGRRGCTRLRWALAPCERPPCDWPCGCSTRGTGLTYAATSPTRACTAGESAVTRCGVTLIAALRIRTASVLALLGQHDGDDVAGAAGAGGAARTVQVRLVLGGRIDVDDEFDVVDVHAAGGDVGGDQNACLAGGERGEVAVTGGLRQVAVQVDGGDAGLGELPGQLAWPGAWCA